MEGILVLIGIIWIAYELIQDAKEARDMRIAQKKDREERMRMDREREERLRERYERSWLNRRRRWRG